MIYGIIYKFTHRGNGKIYIGQTTGTLAKRIRMHVSSAKINAGKVTNKFFKALNFHGIEAFDVCQIDSAETAEELHQKERHWIAALDSMNGGYNSTDGGDFSPMKNPDIAKKVSVAKKGVPLSEANKRALSAAHTGQRNSPESIAKAAASNKGKKRSEEFCVRMREVAKARIISEATKKKIRETLTGRKMTEERKKKAADAHRGRKHHPGTGENIRQGQIAAKLRKQSAP